MFDTHQYNEVKGRMISNIVDQITYLHTPGVYVNYQQPINSAVAG